MKFKNILAGTFLFLGLVFFLGALPLDSLSGSGNGFLANSRPFRGYDIVVFSFLLPFSGFLGLPWILVAGTNLFLLVSPILYILELFTLYRRPRTRIVIWSYISLSAVPLLFILWPDGYFLGAYVWAISVISMCLGTLLSLGQYGQVCKPPQNGFEIVEKVRKG